MQSLDTTSPRSGVGHQEVAEASKETLPQPQDSLSSEMAAAEACLREDRLSEGASSEASHL